MTGFYLYAVDFLCVKQGQGQGRCGQWLRCTFVSLGCKFYILLCVSAGNTTKMANKSYIVLLLRYTNSLLR